MTCSLIHTPPPLHLLLKLNHFSYIIRIHLELAIDLSESYIIGILIMICSQFFQVFLTVKYIVFLQLHWSKINPIWRHNYFIHEVILFIQIPTDIHYCFDDRQNPVTVVEESQNDGQEEADKYGVDGKESTGVSDQIRHQSPDEERDGNRMDQSVDDDGPEQGEALFHLLPRVTVSVVRGTDVLHGGAGYGAEHSSHLAPSTFGADNHFDDTFRSAPVADNFTWSNAVNKTYNSEIFF